MQTLSVLVPAYNEGATIRFILNKLRQVSLDEGLMCGLQMEVVVVNDGSKDNTENEVMNFVAATSDLSVKYVSQPNGGKGTAIRTALKHATGDILVVQDADCEYDPSDFSLMLPSIIKGDCKVVYSITLRSTGFEFCPEFTAKVAKKGYKIIEVPIHYYPRSISEGKKINWRDGVYALWTLLKYKFIK